MVRNYEASGEFANFYPAGATGLTDVHLPELRASPSKQTLSQPSPNLIGQNAGAVLQSGKPSLPSQGDCRSQIKFLKAKKRTKGAASRANGSKAQRGKGPNKSQSHVYDYNPYYNPPRKKSKLPYPAGLPM